MTSSLMSKLDEPRAEAWMPQEDGDTIAGIIVGMDHRDAGYGPYPILTIECSDLIGGKMKSGDSVPKPPATLSLHCLGVVLTTEVDGAELKNGDEVAARFNGKQEGRNGNTYDGWTFKYERSTPMTQLDADPTPGLFGKQS
jgi:hypothetical protein